MPKNRVNFVANFSKKERDRRWQNARKFMRDRQLDAMLVLGSATGEAVDAYLSGWEAGNTVVFSLKGEPILLSPGLQQILSIRPDLPEEEQPWITDIRAGARGAMIVAALKDRGLEKGHIGVIGVGPFAGSWEGWATYGTWDRVVKRLPDCNFENIGQEYGEFILVKSDEELAHVRRAAQVLEQCSAAMLKAVRPGVTDLDVWAAVMKTQVENGFVNPPAQFGSGPNTVGSVPHWFRGIGAPRVLKAGDVITTELAANNGRLVQSQALPTVAIPPISSTIAECARLARQSYEAGLKLLKPGKTFAEVVDAMEGAMDFPGVWHEIPLIHSMNPMMCIGPTGVNMVERMPGAENYPGLGTSHIRGGEIVLEPGMVFQFEPNACIGRDRVNIGGTLIVTENEPEELHKLSTKMMVVGERRAARILNTE
ncbi:MAG: aminopeptidase P family protein [Chloroflexi bacterium]|nr:aminopeptidase P family protein [Chloroflexota bacterium]